MFGNEVEVSFPSSMIDLQCTVNAELLVANLILLLLLNCYK